MEGKKNNKCWKGWKKKPNTKTYSKGSCVKVKNKKRTSAK